MSKQSSPELVPAVADGLDGRLTEFLATLASAGYAEKTQQDKRRVIVPFIRWARKAQLVLEDLDESSVSKFLLRRPRPPGNHGYPERAALEQFLEHLRVSGALPPRRPPKLSAADLLLERYIDHLRCAQGLCARSVEVYSPFVRSFIATQRLPRRRASLDASAIRGYLLQRSQSRSPPYVKLLVAALRSFLRFLFLDGGTVADLSIAVPPVRRWRLSAVPPFLAPDEVARVIAATDRSTTSGRRALAILLLLARLGLRACEVVALELDDVRWDVGEIVVRGKGRVLHRLPLPDDVGKALALYLREARGRSMSRRVFLRRCAPHVGLSGPTAVCVIAREALRRAGLRPAGRVGAHIFRHSLATQMLRHGASFPEISQVLRHRSVATTKLYAKVDLEALRSVALPWPTPEVRP